jgi:anthranilate phosphoribosyltransferase
VLNPADFGVSCHKVKSRGQTIEESAQMFTNIISGNGTEAQNNVVCANAGMAIATTTKCTPLEGFQIAKVSFLEKD